MSIGRESVASVKKSIQKFIRSVVNAEVIAFRILVKQMISGYIEGA